MTVLAGLHAQRSEIHEPQFNVGFVIICELDMKAR